MFYILGTSSVSCATDDYTMFCKSSASGLDKFFKERGFDPYKDLVNFKEGDIFTLNEADLREYCRYEPYTL